MNESLTFVQQLEIVQERIIKACQKAGRNSKEVNLLAVTKMMAPEVVQEAIDAGLKDFGESYVQELRPKEESLSSNINWHFIGQLQSNKAKYLDNCFLIHSLDSLEAAKVISRRSNETRRVLIEINCGEAQKGGVQPQEAAEFIRQVKDLPNIQVCGLMTVPPLWAEGEENRQFFAMLAKLRDNIGAELQLGNEFKELSMGMSGDFEIAIEEGATWIRLGSILFGSRPSGRWWQEKVETEGLK